MATAIEHRLYPRNKIDVPSEIECLSCEEDEHIEARIYDVSGNGLYLETDHQLAPGEGIFIHTLQPVPRDAAGGTEIDNTAGIIRWTREMERRGKNLFGAGVMFYYPEISDEFEARQTFTRYCDWCSKAIGRRSSVKRDDLLWMCPRCSEEIDHLPGSLYFVTVRFLIGNVL